MAKVTVECSMFEEPIEVDEEEVPVLRAQGLLTDRGQPAPSAKPQKDAQGATE